MSGVIVLGVLSENLSHHFEKTLNYAFKIRSIYCAEVLFNWMDARGFKSSITRGATYKSILKVLLKQYRSPTDPNKFKSATIISVDHFQITMRHDDLDR